jgi:hypothetical protein
VRRLIETTDMTRRDAEKAVGNVTLDTNFSIPGDAGFPLNQLFEGPKDRHDAESLRQYMMQMRQELGARLANRVYADGPAPSKVSLFSIVRSRILVRMNANLMVVVVELYEEEVYGEDTVERVRIGSLII